MPPTPAEPQSQSSANQEGQAPAGSNQITPDLVNQLADKVMKMIIEELILEKERSGSSKPIIYHGIR